MLSGLILLGAVWMPKDGLSHRQVGAYIGQD